MEIEAAKARLRKFGEVAVLDAVESLESALAQSRAEAEAAKHEQDVSDLAEQLTSSILKRICLAVKGPNPPNGLHSFHDLPEIVEALTAELEKLRGMVPRWCQVLDRLPPDSAEVLGFHPDWVDEDFNPHGVRACFHNDGDRWHSAKWCDNQDTYESGEENMAPTLWLEGVPVSWPTDGVAPANPPSPTNQPHQALARVQSCGCVICRCENEDRCQGCGAKHCGTHPVGVFVSPIYQSHQAATQDPAPGVGEACRCSHRNVPICNRFTSSKAEPTLMTRCENKHGNGFECGHYFACHTQHPASTEQP